MKKIYFVLSLALISSMTMAQSYYVLPAINAGVNPGDLHNDPEQPSGALTPLGWSEIMGSTSTDQWSPAQTIPFSFDFNGQAETGYVVSNTGVVTFTTTALTVPSSANATIPDASIPPKSICAWGIDLSGGNDAILTNTFGSAPNRQHWIMFASATIPGTSGNNWTYWAIVLEEGTNSIYVVDQRTVTALTVDLTIGIQINSTTAVSITGSPNVGSNTTDGPDASDNTFYEFVWGTQPNYDLDLTTMKIPPMAGINQAMNVEGTVRNKGAQAVTTYDLSYSINGGTPVTASISGNIGVGDFAGTAPTTQHTPTAAGTYEMKVWVSNINGNPDENNTNDTVSASFQAAQAEPRNVLAEEFSSSTCPPCAGWNANVYNAAHVNYNKSGGNTLIVKYQVPIPVAGDPSHNGDADTRRAYYGVNAAPTMLINGTAIDYSASTWAGAAQEYSDKEQDGLAEPAFVSITGQVDFTTTATTGDVSANITVTPNIDLTSGNHALQISVLQKDYVFNGATNGDFNYHHVMRKMLPDPNGSAINTTAGVAQSFTETYNFNVVTAPQEMSFDLWNHDIEVVAYVEDMSTGTILNAQLMNIALIGLDEEANALQVKAYPNPATDVLYVANDAADNEELSIELVNSIGQKVFAKTYGADEVIEINTTSFDAGVYILNVSSENQRGSKRISVIK